MVRLERSGSTNYFILKFFNPSNGVINASSTSISYSGSYRQTMRYSGGVINDFGSTESNSTDGLNASYKTTANQENTLFGMTYLTSTINGTFPLTFVGNDGLITTEYLEYINSFEDNTTYNGNQFTYYFIGDLYSTSKIRIGEVIPNDSYYYEIRMKAASNNYIYGTVFTNIEPFSVFNGDGCLYMDNEQNLYVNTRYLNYNKQYYLEVISYYGDGGDDLYEDIDYYIFLPNNAIVDNTTISSFGSGDFNNQDVTNQMIDYLGDTNDVENLIPDLISGDFAATVGFTNYDSSGDIWRANLNAVAVSIANAISGSGDYYFDFSMHGEAPRRIWTHEFVTPEGPLKTFVRLSMIFGTLYLIFVQITKLINHISSANVEEACNDVRFSFDIYKM